ncbi:MAG: ABC transporter ATP-binding protein [Clostridiaceae bacterium]
MEIKNLNFGYDAKPVLNDINLSFPKGKFISILGPNGSGKSTLVKLILGLLKPIQGEIKVNTVDLSGLKMLQKARLMAYVPQIFQTNFEFTVKDVVGMGRYPYIKQFGNFTEKDTEICAEAMRITETVHLADQKVTKISGGESQRVSVARALAQTTPWILLDEPVNHLDISHQISILKSLKAMTPERTIIAVMHDLNLARDFSDHVILMQEGRIIKTGRPGECINPEVLSSIYDLEFLKTYTEDRTMEYLFPKTR